MDSLHLPPWRVSARPRSVRRRHASFLLERKSWGCARPPQPVTIPSPAHVDEQEEAAGERRPAAEGPEHVCRTNSSHKLCFSCISCLCSDFVCPDPSWSPPAQGLAMTSAPRAAEGWRPSPSMSLCDPPLPQQRAGNRGDTADCCPEPGQCPAGEQSQEELLASCPQRRTTSRETELNRAGGALPGPLGNESH